MGQAKSNSYAYVIERAEDGSYWAYLPDLPGCITAADSPEQIEQQLPEAVDLYLSYYRNRGLPPPTPQVRVSPLSERKDLGHNETPLKTRIRTAKTSAKILGQNHYLHGTAFPPRRHFQKPSPG